MIKATLDVMGTGFALEVPDGTHRDVIDEVFEWWRTVERTFSTFKPDSQISLIGRNELDLDDAHPDVRHVLAVCREIEEQTGGRFSARPGRSDRPALDPAGYVKGWSVDEAALMLGAANISNFAIYAGGDVRCAGAPPDTAEWQIGIRIPHRPEAIGAVVAVNDGAVASSGTYRRGGHIWGAKGSVRGATVVGPHLGVADALATAVMAGQDESFEWLAPFPGYSVIVFWADGTMSWSKALDDRITIASTE